MSINFDYNFPQLARETGFKLKHCTEGTLDWRTIGCLDIERILREQSFEQVDGILTHLSEVPLGNILLSNILDSGISKYFVLSQFALQYLLFCRKFLDESVRELRESLVQSQGEVVNLRASLTEANNEIVQLNKRIHQIEAIHEVVYPCHLCSKNFISNEALNIHIGRKHNCKGKEMSSEPSTCRPRDKDNDRILINAVKLELEIKQLKERLNVAEKSIKERDATPIPQAPPTQSDGAERLLRDVAIQSNLAEEKEVDCTKFSHVEVNEVPSSAVMDIKEQLEKMQGKVDEVQHWMEIQKVTNDGYMIEMNKKFNEISVSLNEYKEERNRSPDHDFGLKRTLSPSVDDLEKLLTTKVKEIGNASIVKLEEIAGEIEHIFRGKLNEIEKEVLHNQKISPNQVALDSTDDNDEQQYSKSPSTKYTSNDENCTIEYIKNCDDVDNVDERDLNREKVSEGNSNSRKSVSVVSEEATFTESSDPFTTIKVPRLKIVGTEDSSDTSSDRSPTSETEDSLFADFGQAESTSKYSTQQTTTTGNEDEDSAPKSSPRSPPTPVECKRRDAKLMATRRLRSLGFDLSKKTISTTIMKNACAELAERRKDLKDRYPNFMATRDRIKNYVDKLCSTKMPEAEEMLEVTQPRRPMRVGRSKPLVIRNAGTSSTEKTTDGSQTHPEVETSTTSPGISIYTSTTKADVHANPAHVSLPIPVKRVAFSQVSDEKNSDDSDMDIRTKCQGL